MFQIEEWKNINRFINKCEKELETENPSTEEYKNKVKN